MKMPNTENQMVGKREEIGPSAESLIASLEHVRMKLEGRLGAAQARLRTEFAPGSNIPSHKVIEGIRLDTHVTHLAWALDMLPPLDIAVGRLPHEILEARRIIEKKLGEATSALGAGDLSLAKFPRIGGEALAELTEIVSVLQQILQELPAAQSVQERKMPKSVVEVGFEKDGLSIEKATLDLTTGHVSGIHPIHLSDDDGDGEASIVLCQKTVPVTRQAGGSYVVGQEQLAALQDSVLEDLRAGLKIRLADGSIQDGFIVWEGGADVARRSGVEGAKRVAQALRTAGSVEHIWVTKGSEFESVYDDPDRQAYPNLRSSACDPST
jgi:hypothetical protein